ncbi:unnamed protein product [Callosobruchus maculatus]|uniref:Uncharacterized protein n=1 Tax=Callosobruchus maculatus TaxID=64391 RepID=A0A653CUN9_CALMS|nr:unnamed protein product [Callosobruchus maculatus]
MMCFEPACDESRAVEDQSNVEGICCDTAGLKGKKLVPYDSSSDDDCDLVTEDYELSSESVVDPNLLDIEVTGDADVLTEQNSNSVRKKQRYADEKNWQRNKNKRLRMKGQKYLGFSKKKGGKIEQNHPRAERKLKARCTSQKCLQSKIRHCQEISEDCRQETFHRFWNDMNWDQRKVFIASHVIKLPTHKKTKENSRRQGTYHYYLSDGHDNLEVCRAMFLSTLDLGYKTVQAWVDNSKYGLAKESLTGITVKDHVSKRRTVDYQHLHDFFESLPKLPSHYCRRDTSKMYLEYTFESMSDLYRVYCSEFCSQRTIIPLGRNVFSKIFKQKNLSLYTPKKDQCNTCFSFKYGNISTEDYERHIVNKDKAREAKIIDKSEAEKGTSIVLTMDLQAVKLCPYIPANKTYFKTKLCCHNFTVYNLSTKDVLCYWFSEDQVSSLKASVFTSCIINYLQENCLPSPKVPIVLYSDGCGYQNRNSVLANALLNFSMQNNVYVFQKYLEPGHTQMECDSVHSVIERKLRNREIHLPSDYEALTREARKTPHPYRTRNLEWSFFKNYASCQHQRYSSIRPGRKPQDPTINSIRVIKYDPNGTIQVKTEHDGPYMDLPCRPKPLPPILDYPPLFSGRSKIKQEKWQHLQDLKSVISKDTHAFYDNLRYE